MTSRISFSKMIRNDIKRRVWLFAILLLVFIITGPISLLIMAENLKTYTYGQEFYNSMAAFFNLNYLRDLPILFFSGVIVGLSGFSYVFSKRKVDLYHSLPIKREKLFIAQYASGLIMYVVALLVKFISCIIISVAGGYLTKTAVTNIMSSYTGELIHFLFIYNVMILAVMLTGSLLASVLGFIAANAVYPVYSFCISYLMGYCYVTKADATALVEKVPYFSPFASVATYMMTQNDSGAKASALVIHNIFVFIIAVLCIIGAYYLYKIRRSESALRTIAFDISKPIIRIPIVILGGIVGGTAVLVSANKFMTSWVWIGIIVGVVTTHALCEASFNNDYKSAFKNWKQLMICLVATVGIFGIIFVDLFGYDKYIPNRNKIEAATVVLPLDYDISYNEIKEVNGSGQVVIYYSDRDEYMYKRAFTNPEIIDVVYAFSKLGVQYVDDMKENRKNNNAGHNEVYEHSPDELRTLSPSDLYILDEEAKGSDTLEYKVYFKLASGKEVKRVYYVDKNEAKKLFKAIYDKKEFKRAHYDIYDAYEKDIFTNVEVYDAFSERQVQLSGDEGKELLSIYLDELENAKFEDICEIPIASISPKYLSIWNYQEGLGGYYIYPSFKKTLSYMKNLGTNMDNMVSIPDALKVDSIQVSAYDYVHYKETDESMYVYGLMYLEDNPEDKEMIDLICKNTKLYGLTWSNDILYDKENRVEISIYYRMNNGIQQSATAYFDAGAVPNELKNDIIEWAAANPSY